MMSGYQLYRFVEREVTDTIIAEDLNYLLPAKKFQLIRKVLKREVLSFIYDEILRQTKPELQPSSLPKS